MEKVKRDKTSYGELYQYFYRDVFRFAQSLLNNMHDAEDITSQTFLTFYEKIEQYTWNGKSIKSWLFQTVRFLVYNKLRRPVHIPFDDDDDSVSFTGISFADQVINRDLVRTVQKEINALPLLVRETIILRIWEDMQFNEIAQLQNRPVNSVKTQFYRAVGKIKSKLEIQKTKNRAISLLVLFSAIRDSGTNKSYKVPHFNIPKSFETLQTTQNTTMNTGILTQIISYVSTKAGIAVVASTAVVGVTAGTVGVATYNNAQQDREAVVSTNTTAGTPAPTITIEENTLNIVPEATIAPTTVPIVTTSPTLTPSIAPTTPPTSIPVATPVSSTIQTFTATIGYKVPHDPNKFMASQLGTTIHGVFIESKTTGRMIEINAEVCPSLPIGSPCVASGYTVPCTTPSLFTLGNSQIVRTSTCYGSLEATTINGVTTCIAKRSVLFQCANKYYVTVKNYGAVPLTNEFDEVVRQIQAPC